MVSNMQPAVIHPQFSENEQLLNSFFEVSELAAEAKKEAKNITGNALFISRRRKIRMLYKQ